jgi:PAS domain S-box-containing protein
MEAARMRAAETGWRSTLTDCGLAIGGVAMATLARHLLDPWLGKHNPFAFYFIAIMIAAWFGGMIPGAITLLLGALAGSYFFVEPRGTLFVHTFSDVLAVAMYCIVGGTVLAFSEVHRTALRRSQETAERLRLHEQELEREIADRRQIEESLRASEERFRRLSDANILGVIAVDADDRIINANDEFLRMLGYARDEFIRRKPRWPDLTPAKYVEVDAQAMKQIQELGSCTPYEKEYLHKDGTPVPVLIGGAPLQAAGEGRRGVRAGPLGPDPCQGTAPDAVARAGEHGRGRDRGRRRFPHRLHQLGRRRHVRL